MLSRAEFVAKLGLQDADIPPFMHYFARAKVEGWKEAGGAESAAKAILALREGRKAYLERVRLRQRHKWN